MMTKRLRHLRCFLFTALVAASCGTEEELPTDVGQPDAPASDTTSGVQDAIGDASETPGDTSGGVDWGYYPDVDDVSDVEDVPDAEINTDIELADAGPYDADARVQALIALECDAFSDALDELLDDAKRCRENNECVGIGRSDCHSGFAASLNRDHAPYFDAIRARADACHVQNYRLVSANIADAAPGLRVTCNRGQCTAYFPDSCTFTGPDAPADI